MSEHEYIAAVENMFNRHWTGIYAAHMVPFL